MAKQPQYRLFKLKSFWLALIAPTLLVLITAFVVLYQTSVVFNAQADGIGYAAIFFTVLLVILAMVLPSIALVVLNHRNQQAAMHHDLLRQQYNFSHHYLHTEQFTLHMPTELLKRLGIAPRVLHGVFYANSRDGEFAINDKLTQFIHLTFVEVVQAAQVVDKLYDSPDDDEKAVGQNRLEFVISQSVALMYFFAKVSKGQTPQCMDYYFLKDAMADYYDLLMEVCQFDGQNDNHYDLRVFSRLFEVQSIKSWFARNEHFLRQACEDSDNNNRLFDQFNRAN